MSADNLTRFLNETDVVAIVTTRRGGELLATPIWAVVVGGVAYIRSAYGPDSWWYRHVQSGRLVAIATSDGALAERDREAALALPREQVRTTDVPSDSPIQEAIDEEILRKYAGAPQSSIDAMLTAEARSCTLRIDAVS